jgi:hypothetical protein
LSSENEPLGLIAAGPSRLSTSEDLEEGRKLSTISSELDGNVSTISPVEDEDDGYLKWIAIELGICELKNDKIYKGIEEKIVY